MHTSREKEAAKDTRRTTGPQQVLFPKTSDPSIIVGVVTDSKPSSLALLAAGVAGMAARRARREQTQ